MFSRARLSFTLSALHVSSQAIIFSREAQRLIRRHARLHGDRWETPTSRALRKPLMLYLPFQSVHGPDEVPPQFAARYARGDEHHIADPARRTHQGMVTALDEAIGNLTATLKEEGLYENTIVWFMSDNGGPIPDANNAPLRGGQCAPVCAALGSPRAEAAWPSPSPSPRAMAPCLSRDVQAVCGGVRRRRHY